MIVLWGKKGVEKVKEMRRDCQLGGMRGLVESSNWIGLHKKVTVVETLVDKENTQENN